MLELPFSFLWLTTNRDENVTSLWWVKWQLEMVIAVEPMMASMRPSWQLDMETWSIQILDEPKIEIPSPSLGVLKPTWSLLSLIVPPLPATMLWIWMLWMITFLTNWSVMPAPLAIRTLAPLPSMVLCPVMISSWLSLMTMLRANTIQRGFFWITACLRVPGLGLTMSPSEESVTT